MSAVAASTAGLVDLEKELTCSICTELLYQPLTLLDCLHTFCGSCLKEWFSWQASSSSGADRRLRFTCPSCRASVRDTRHDAKVTTLLDLFLQSNPAKGRSENEKEEIGKKYKPNENIFSVSPDRNTGVNEDDHDQRLLTEVREMSLRDTGGRGGRPRTGQSHPRPSRERSSGDRSRERRLEEARRRRRTERQLAAPPPPRTTSELSSQESRQIEHQSSLRSLLSSSEGDSAIEDEILRQITEEGLLDGIDLRNLDPSQEDELTERIADAYRRRFLSHYASLQSVQSSAQRDQPSRPDEPPETSQVSGTVDQPAASRTNMLDTTSLHGTSLSHPRGSSSHETRRRRPSPNPASADPSSDNTGGQETESTRPRRPSQNDSPARASHRRAISAASATERTGDGRRRRQPQHARSRSTDHRRAPEQPNTDDSVAASSQVPTSGSRTTARTGSNTGSSESRSRREAPDPTLARAERRNIPLTSCSSRPNSSRGEVNAPTASPLYPEPSISCDRCGQQDIQYSLHKSCGKCNDGNYNICLRCYRLGRGCLHWFGFGYRAQLNFDRKYRASGQDSVPPEAPHILQSQKYLQPADTIQSGGDGSGRASRDDPDRRLQRGNFCDMCDSFADDCFWKCDRCNDGEWGFCNRCVNHGHCCTHPLLPIARIQPSQDSGPHSLGSPNNASISIPQPPPNVTRDGENYRTLTFSTKCNMCTYPISPSSTRFHCPECNEGDYDMCTNCYLKLCASGRISKENGQNGWRRCLSGHRMIIVGFEDREDGQRRVIVKGLVGGYAMKDDLDPNSPTSPTSPQQSSNDAITTFPSPERQDSGKWTWKDGTESGGSSPTTSTGQRRRANRSRNHWAASGDGSKATAPSFPPSGGIGLRMAAVWSYYPDPEESDEIMFPRGAEITEAENINDDWFWGCYAGQKGLFPGGYAGLIERVGGVN